MVPATWTPSQLAETYGVWACAGAAVSAVAPSNRPGMDRAVMSLKEIPPMVEMRFRTPAPRTFGSRTSQPGNNPTTSAAAGYGQRDELYVRAREFPHLFHVRGKRRTGTRRPVGRKRPPAYPAELAYPCCLPALGEFGKMPPRGGLRTSVSERCGSTNAGRGRISPARRPTGTLLRGGFA